jgi:hypothetical protein
VCDKGQRLRQDPTTGQIPLRNDDPADVIEIAGQRVGLGLNRRMVGYYCFGQHRAT